MSALWTNYTGCDSLYSTAADSKAVYFGGHERWSQNPPGCDNPGPGAISAPGMEGLSPATGLLTFNPTRARVLGIVAAFERQPRPPVGAELDVLRPSFDRFDCQRGILGP